MKALERYKQQINVIRAKTPKLLTADKFNAYLGKVQESKLVFEIHDQVAKFSDGAPSPTEVIGLLQLSIWSPPLIEAMSAKPLILKSCKEVASRHFKQHLDDSFKKMNDIMTKLGVDPNMLLRLCEASVSHADKVAKLSPIVLTAVSEVQPQTVKDFSDCLTLFDAFMGSEAMNFEDTIKTFCHEGDYIAPSFALGSAILAKLLPAFPAVATILINHKLWFAPYSFVELFASGAEAGDQTSIKDCIKEPTLSILEIAQADPPPYWWISDCITNWL